MNDIQDTRAQVGQTNGAVRSTTPAEIRAGLRLREEALSDLSQTHVEMRKMLEEHEDLAKFVALADKLGWFHVPRNFPK